MRSVRLRSIVVLGSFTLLAAACRPGVGQCSDDDMRSARTIAYDAQGSPAYAGQAIMITSCAGGGSFCHASDATRRYGAPSDLNFDPLLADDMGRYPDEPTGAAHLLAAQILIHRDRDDIYGTVWDRSMPPGQAGADTQAAAYRTYASDADTNGTPVPGLDTNEGLEALRVWLACGSPVIESTTPIPARSCSGNADCSPLQLCDFSTSQCVPVGAVIARRASTSTATWSSIYTSILAPTCATDACHGAPGARFSGNLDLSTSDIAYAALVGVGANVPSCGTRVVAGNPDQSFLVAKLEGTQNPVSCGSAMPIGTMLPSDQIALVRSWITGGAPHN